MIKSGYNLAALFLFLVIFAGCKDRENDNVDFRGEWTIDLYKIYSEVDDEVINDQTAEDAGFFRFMNDGTGVVTIIVPGISLVDNPISWSFDEDNEELTIDYQNGLDPFNYEVSFHSGDRITLRYEEISQSNGSISLFRNTIELSFAER